MKTYKFKLYKSRKQKHLHRRVWIAGQIYNHIIALHKRYYRRYGKYISKYRMQAHLKKIKKYQKFYHWKEVGSQAIQDIIFRIDFGYQKFFRKENKRPPNFRKGFKFKSFSLSFATRNKVIFPVGWKILSKGKIEIDSITYKFWQSKKILGQPKRLHVKRDRLGDFYICIVTDYEEEYIQYHATSSNSVGGDFGLKTFLFLSDGKPNIECPQFFKRSMKEIAKANKNLSSKKKGSNHRKEARFNLARIHKAVSNRREDWQWKTAKDMCEKYAAIFLEDLNLNAMKKLWGRKVSDLAFYQFVQILKQQAKKTGTIVFQIDRFEPTTKKCHVCDEIKEGLTLADREWDCDHCGTHHDRDENASESIKIAGTSAIGLSWVRPGTLVLAPTV